MAERPGEQTALNLDHSGLLVKIRKRLLFPLRLALKDYDVLHIVDNDYLAGVAPWRLRRTVVTCHDMMPLLLYGQLEDAFARSMGRYFYRNGLEKMPRCGQVVTDSQFSKSCILKHTGCAPEDVQVIHLGVDESFREIDMTAPDCQAFVERHGLGGRRLLLHVGTAEPYKNIETVLGVLHRLAGSSANPIGLLKVGGTFSAEQKALIGELGLGNLIVHLKGLSEQELVWAYNAADVLLWPSRFEGFGLAVPEAMACGTPVVCSNGGSLAEIAGDAAAVHDPDDLDGLTASCLRVLEDEGYRQDLRTRGFVRASHFSWDRAASGYCEVYARVHREAGGG
ncbi:MAG: glycosyltransferase [Nitrospiraceae bacterium]|nr:glycosyltransferase [Nitrospiraceae bacterium]